MNGLLDYQCIVHKSGYEIVNLEVIMDNKFEATSEVEYEKYCYVMPIDPKSTKRVFNLIDHPGAYKEFMFSLSDAVFHAETKSNDEEWFSVMSDCIIAFANKYGLLTESIQEETKVWFPHLLMMMISVNSLKYIKDGSIEDLNRLFIKKDGSFKISFNAESIFVGQSDIPTTGQTPPRNSSEAAYHYICKVVNHNLNDSLVTEIIANPANTGTDMIVRPKNLISALWLQLANTVSRNLEFKQCVACSTFFEVKSKKRHFEKIYCSDKCRKRVSATAIRAKEKAHLEREKAK